MNGKIIGRYAPSPSGVMHLGNLSTSLLAWLDARSAGGEILLRIEDLDPERSSEGFARQITDDLRYLGLDWDNTAELRQGERTALYEDVFALLLKKNMIYPCYCSRSQRLAASAPHPGETTSDKACRCRSLSPHERMVLEAAGKRAAWKVKVPDTEIEFCDLHYGKIRERLSDSGDFIVRRSDGIFAYQLAVSFDDMDMGVTRVVRGRDLLGSTARQIWLITELGGTPPVYCHAPLITSADKRKMSKRDGDLNMNALRERYSPEDILGMLGKLLGLSDGSPRTAMDLLRVFDWERVPGKDIIIE